MSSRDNRGRLIAENASYQQALDYIYSFIDYESQPRPRDPVHYDLRRMDELLARLGNPHLKAETIHIAGSKGKGSVAAMISSALTASGYTTGLFTSPHLLRFNERMRVDGELISDDEVTSLVEKLKPAVIAVNEEAIYGRLTTFELITALSFCYFELKKVDFQVIEVGLGGTLDATNVVRPKVCVITAISFEHTDVLGNTLMEIAANKAGIIKPDCVTVTSPQAYEAIEVIESTCQENQVELIKVGNDVTWQRLDFNVKQQSLLVKGRIDNYKISIPLLGQHQLENAATAVTTLEVLFQMGFHISKDSIINGMSRVNWPGRLQVLNLRPLIVIDGAHNPDSAIKLKQAIQQYFDFDKAIVIFGASADKDIEGIIAGLFPLFDTIIATHSIHPRAMATEAVADQFRKQGIETFETNDISEALPMALDMAGENDLICVTGSLFVVAGAIEQAEQFHFSV